ncbi:MAG TPA: V-type ATP synthase subunit E [Longimicrobiales bacterium]|nr:V-type ATP synthase subunit E [Longimicrobiales bacterium]
MALQHLLAAIARDGDEAARRELDAAREEAERILAEARARIEARLADRLKVRERTLRASLEAELAAERRRAAGELLRARWRLVERILADAAARLPAAAQSAAFAEALPAQLEEALAYLGDGGGVVRCPPPLVPLVSTLLAGRPGISVEACEDGAGIRVLVPGAVEVDDTLEARLRRLGPRLAMELLGLAESEP